MSSSGTGMLRRDELPNSFKNLNPYSPPPGSLTMVKMAPSPLPLTYWLMVLVVKEDEIPVGEY